MLAGSSKGIQYTSALRYRLRECTEDPDLFDTDGYTGRECHYTPSEVVLESKICQGWKLGRCNKGEKCRFRHKTSSQEQYTSILPDKSGNNLSNKDAGDYPAKEVPRAADNSDDDSSSNGGTQSGDDSEDSDVDEQEKGREKDLQNGDSPSSLGVLMTLLVLEQLRQAIFNPGREGIGRRRSNEEELQKEIINSQKRLEMFDGLGNTRREELAIVKDQETKHIGENNRKGVKRWVEEEDTENKDDINRMLETLGRRRKEQRLSSLETEEYPGEIPGKGNLGEFQVEQGSVDLMSTISHYIVLESNLVTCGAGLEIHQITPGYDLCQISLQLPIETTGTEIVEMLLEEGLDTSDFHVLRIEENGERLEAIILTNFRFGDTLGTAFGNREIDFEVRRDAIWALGTMAPGNAPSLMLTWDSEDSSLSLSEEKSQIELAAVYDSLFELEGVRMESCCLLISPASELAVDQVTLTVEFDNWENALQAVGDIRLKQPSSIPSFQAKTPNARQHSICIPLPQYEVQRKQWLELLDTDSREDSEEGQPELEIEVTGNEVVIQVQGESKALVGALKVRAEKVVRGEILDGIYWHPSFASSESASFFGEVMQSTVTYLRCCPDTHTLVLYGESGNIEKARMMIQAEVNRREQILTKTTLTGSSISFFKNGGVHKLRDLVGEEAVDLKSTSRWSAIMMRGGETATHHLRRLIKESLVKELVSFQNLPSATTCPVCLDEQLHPEVLECGHGYCSGCLNRFLGAAADNQEFPIVCVGDGGTCNVPITLPFIHQFLPRHSFKRLIEAALVTYLQRNPTQFRYCRTPDCRQTYRRQSEDKATIMTCPSCFAKTCSSCSYEHQPNMTCTEYRISNDPEEQERLNNELADTIGYKRCPSCAVWVEKTGGCNHMSCKCGAHTCWICLRIFDAHSIYVHMPTCLT